jgi:hypothetical protein
MNIVDNLEEELWEYRRNYTYEESPRAIIMHPGTLEDLATTKTEPGSPIWTLTIDDKAIEHIFPRYHQRIENGPLAGLVISMEYSPQLDTFQIGNS